MPVRQAPFRPGRPPVQGPRPGPAGPPQPPGIAEQPTTVMRLPSPQPTRRYEPQAPTPTLPQPEVRRPQRDESYEAPEPSYRQEFREPPRERPEPSYRQRDESPVDYQRARDRRTDRTNLIANVIHVGTAFIAFVFVLHIVFTLFGANQNSGFVAFVYDVAKVFVFGFGDVFTPSDAKLGLIANYGLAAIVYLVVGRILYRTLRNG